MLLILNIIIIFIKFFYLDIFVFLVNIICLLLRYLKKLVKIIVWNYIKYRIFVKVLVIMVEDIVIWEIWFVGEFGFIFWDYTMFKLLIVNWL